MNWPFEHWDNGKVYLHNERWEEFRKNVDKYGQGYPHNWNHTRLFVCLHTPRDSIMDLPAPGDPDLKHRIESHEEWTMIYEPYPAFVRTHDDPEGWLPSWHMWAEDNHVGGESLSILHTGNIYKQSDDGLIRRRFTSNHFAAFRCQFWNMQTYVNLGVGPNEPPKKKPKSKLLMPRSIFDPFEGNW
jgi:hypothetical protein